MHLNQGMVLIDTVLEHILLIVVGNKYILFQFSFLEEHSYSVEDNPHLFYSSPLSQPMIKEYYILFMDNSFLKIMAEQEHLE